MLNFLLSPEGRWESGARAELHQNRGFLFGDGFFETIRQCSDGLIPLASFHAGRISRSAAQLGFSGFTHFSEAGLLRLISGIPAPPFRGDRRLKLVFFRQGPGAYAPETSCTAGIYAEVSELAQPFISRISNLGISEKVQLFPSAWAGIKSLSALPYVLAARERREMGADEILLLSPDGLVVEGSFSAVFWKDSLGIRFAEESLGGVDSCMRRFLRHHFQAEKISCNPARIEARTLFETAGWILCASALGLRFFSQEKDFRLPEEFSQLAGLGFSGWELPT